MLRTAYLLQRQWRDTDQGLQFELWLASREGPLRVLFSGQEAVCFVPRSSRLAPGPWRRTEVALSDFDGAPVDALYFPRQRQLDEWAAEAAHRPIAFEADINPVERFLMERFVRGGVALDGDWRSVNGVWECLNPRLRAAEDDTPLRALSLDIETGGGRGAPLYSVGLSDPEHARVFMAREAPPGADDERIVWCGDERGALRAAFAHIAAHDPDLLLGWNLIDFDLVFLADCCARLNEPFAIGRGGRSASVPAIRTGSSAHVARIPGRVAMDGPALLRAAFYRFESFSLDNVAHELLGERKLIIATGIDKLAEIQRQFREDPVQLAHYNRVDCELTQRIFEAAGLIDFARAKAGLTGLPLDRHTGAVPAFDQLYLPRLHRTGRVAPSLAQVPATGEAPGGFVFDGQPGRTRNVLLMDFKSLYPSIIRSFLIDPANRRAAAGPDTVPGFGGAHFAREQSVLPTLVAELWAARDAAKARHDTPLSTAIKIIMNSLYGVLGASNCRFHHHSLTGSITRRGHAIIQAAARWIEAAGEQVIYGDTDSVFVQLDPALSPAQCLARGTALRDGLNAHFTAELAREYQLESHLELELEGLFVDFWLPALRGGTGGAKKRYAGRLHTEQGPELVVKGLESVRSDWCPLARRFQRELLLRWFDDRDLAGHCLATHARLRSGELDEELIFHKKLRRPISEYTKNTPPHVRAAKLLPKPGRRVSYRWTTAGPAPVGFESGPIDYDYYAEHQLAPIADDLLGQQGLRWAEVVSDQLGLF